MLQIRIIMALYLDKFSKFTSDFYRKIFKTFNVQKNFNHFFSIIAWTSDLDSTPFKHVAGDINFACQPKAIFYHKNLLLAVTVHTSLVST